MYKSKITNTNKHQLSSTHTHNATQKLKKRRLKKGDMADTKKKKNGLQVS